MAPQGPYKLVTVNTAPERARKLVGTVVEELKDQYTVIHAANVETIEAARGTFEQIMPDIVFTASMWKSEESAAFLKTAREVNPAVKTLAIPQGLQVEKGPDAVVEFVKEKLPMLINS